MTSWKPFIKKLFFPITILTLLSLVCGFVLLESMYLHIATPTFFSSMYLSVAIPITLVVWVLYAFERWLLKKTTYKKILFIELGITAFLIVYYSYQNASTSIQFDTNKSFVLVLFDGKDAATYSFERSGVFNKKRIIKDTNIIHLHPSFELKKDLKIVTPKNWKRTTTDKSSLSLKGKEVAYLFVTNSELPKSYIINSEKYIDSLLQVTTIK
ncbi:MAG: hypothetical protein NWQ17_01490 [Polaribacter sp.]|nr:hypothetical protein [Polaribacter sp.]